MKRYFGENAGSTADINDGARGPKKSLHCPDHKLRRLVTSATESHAVWQPQRNAQRIFWIFDGSRHNNEFLAKRYRLTVDFLRQVRRAFALDQAFNDLAILGRNDSGQVDAFGEIGSELSVILENADCTVLPKLGNQIVAAVWIRANNDYMQRSILENGQRELLRRRLVLNRFMKT
jgi:hypothetical protein